MSKGVHRPQTPSRAGVNRMGNRHKGGMGVGVTRTGLYHVKDHFQRAQAWSFQGEQDCWHWRRMQVQAPPPFSTTRDEEIGSLQKQLFRSSLLDSRHAGWSIFGQRYTTHPEFLPVSAALSPRPTAGGRRRWRVVTGQIILQYHVQRRIFALARTGTITAFAVRICHVSGTQNREGSLRGVKLMSLCGVAHRWVCQDLGLFCTISEQKRAFFRKYSQS